MTTEESKMNRKRTLCLFAVITSLLSLYGGNNQEKIRCEKSAARSHVNHPEIEGFTYTYGYVDDLKKAENTTGYFYYDMDVYQAPFTLVSNLFLIRVAVEYTAGSHAHDLGEDFDSNFDLDFGYIKIHPYQYTSGSKATSNLRVKTGWPNTDTRQSTVTLSSGFGASLSLGPEWKVGMNLGYGVEVTNKSSTSLTFSNEKTISIIGNEPAINFNHSSEKQDQLQWSYQFAGYGKTYYQEAYCLIEVEKGSKGYQDYSFKFDVEIKMDNSAWRNFPWERHYPVTLNANEEYGVYA